MENFMQILTVSVGFFTLVCILLSWKKNFADSRSFWAVLSILSSSYIVLMVTQGDSWLIAICVLVAVNSIWDACKLDGNIVPESIKNHWHLFVMAISFAAGFIFMVSLDLPIPGTGVPYYFMRYVLIPAIGGAAFGLVASNVCWLIKGKPQNMPIQI